MNQLTPHQRSTFECQVKKTCDINERNRSRMLLARDDGDHIAHVLRLSLWVFERISIKRKNSA